MTGRCDDIIMIGTGEPRLRSAAHEAFEQKPARYGAASGGWEECVVPEIRAAGVRLLQVFLMPMTPIGADATGQPGAPIRSTGSLAWPATRPSPGEAKRVQQRGDLRLRHRRSIYFDLRSNPGRIVYVTIS